MSDVRVLVAEDDIRVRNALVDLLALSPGFVVAAEASDEHGANGKLESSRPDVVLVDVSLPDVRAGLRLIRRCASMQVPVIAMSISIGLRDVALRAGADGFVDKGTPPEALLATLSAHSARGNGPDLTVQPAPKQP